MYTVKNVIAGIVTYQPEVKRLAHCLSSVQSQVNKIVVFDNGSSNIEEIRELISERCKGVFFIENGENAGIATALSRIMVYAGREGYMWVLTIDQDSLLQPGTVDAYLRGANEFDDAGMFTCLIKDRNFSDAKYESQIEEYKEVPYCITSAAFTSVDAYQKTAGYDESFFIDCVDFDICYSLRESGFQIIRVNHVGLLHEVGHGENRRFLWKKIVVYHEKPNRIYYLARNTKRLHKKHKIYGVTKLIKKEVALLLRIVLYEDQKSKKLCAFFKGLQDR